MLKATSVGAKTVKEPSLSRLVSRPAVLSRSSRMVKLPSAANTSIIVPSLLVALVALDEVLVVVRVVVTGVVVVTPRVAEIGLVVVTGAVNVVAVVVVVSVRVTAALAVTAGVVAPVPNCARAGS